MQSLPTKALTTNLFILEKATELFHASVTIFYIFFTVIVALVKYFISEAFFVKQFYKNSYWNEILQNFL